ncbi:hypothetical protein PR202_gb23319 [Eleusine coracana subsp. coracana]|uniref:At1g61320/AtMIF1 LRR domain-containing protein n=1 Tax=Eleusine coracana subsp. coracana TaxID=191504 RepID=A0AAV5FI46_ELECO|nr:hypothetical protein PR202_gb23319 [Eleusine coracana subsp. coracana]
MLPVLPGDASDERVKKLIHRIDHIVQNHSGIGVKTLKLQAGEYNARQDTINQDFNADSSHIRRIPEFIHPNLKKVTINRFCPVKSLIELTCQIIENTSSLRCLMLDTTRGFSPRGMCKSMDKEDVVKALSAVETVKRYITVKVPPSVKFKVWEPCSRCHMGKL